MNDRSRGDLDRLRQDYRELLIRLERNQAHFRQLARSVYRVQEDERRRLARELHDGLGQNLTALRHTLGLLIDQLPADAGSSRQTAERALSICCSSLEDTRQMARLLRPQVLDDLGLWAALGWLCRSLAESTGLAIELTIDDEPALDAERQTVVFRVVQEALTNVARHAQARTARVATREIAGWLRIEVCDDGIGLGNAAERGGSGLGGMRERLALFGGSLQLRERDGGGLCLRALLPLDPDEPACAE